MKQTLKLYKIMILYMLSKVDFPLTTSQISRFILDAGYTTYFKFQQALSELCENGLLSKESTHNRTFYRLTEDGAKAVLYLQDDISPEIRKDIDRFIREKRVDFKSECSVKADFFPNENGEFSVRCQVTEHAAPLVDLTLSVPTETQAQKLASNWLSKSEEIYAFIMGKLL